MTREEAIEVLTARLGRWRERVAEHVETARALRTLEARMAPQLADTHERAAVNLEREALALSLLLSCEGGDNGC